MKQWLAFWMLGFIWGSSFLLIKIAVDELGVLPLVSVRLAVAGSLMVVYLKVSGYTFPTRRADILGVMFVGFLNVALPFSLITHAEESIDSSLATILNSTVPLFSLVIAHFALSDERLTRYKILGLLIGYTGIVVLTQRDEGDSGNSSVAGQAMMLAAAICYAASVVFIRMRLRHLQPMSIAGLSLVMGAFLIVPLTLLTEKLPAIGSLSTDTIVAISILSTVNTVLAYVLFYHLISEWGARATMVTYVFPPVGITLGAVFLGEAVDSSLMLGSTMILLGIFAVNFKPKQTIITAVTPQKS